MTLWECTRDYKVRTDAKTVYFGERLYDVTRYARGEVRGVSPGRGGEHRGKWEQVRIPADPAGLRDWLDGEVAARLHARNAPAFRDAVRPALAALFDRDDPATPDDWVTPPGAGGSFLRWARRVAREIAAASDPGETEPVTEQPVPAEEKEDAPEFDHGPDYRTCLWSGERFDFTPYQAEAIKVLHEYPNGVGQAFILEAINSAGQRLRDVFKNHPAWGTMIVSVGKGAYKIAPPKPR